MEYSRRSHARPIELRFTVMALALCVAACSSKPAKSPNEREKVIPDETQRASEQMSGQQQIFMGELSNTTSEQAGVRHEQAVQSVRDPDEEEGAKKK
jgi:starvation-inducible outer membrane lipoprotein